jgi:hypothetical protein
MAEMLETRACRKCSMAKRRCGKQTPQCLRCRRRGFHCTYPPVKQTSFVPCRGDDRISAEQQDIVLHTASQFSAYTPISQSRGIDDLRPITGFDVHEISNNPTHSQSLSVWFTSPETWKVDHLLPVGKNTSTIQDLKRQITTIQQWLAQWVEKGSNPFIHPRLYRNRLPKSIQDAYASLACYVQKRESNEHIVLQIIRERSKQLLAEHGFPSAGSLTGTTSRNSAALDPLEHVARVQALLIYQVVGLYDADIRLRHLSETQMPVLNLWLQEMIESASQAAHLGSFMFSSAREQTSPDFSLADTSQSDNLLWYSWILAESIRRTWLIATGVHTIYLIMQQGQISCRGGMVFTTRKGVWEAQSAPAWEKLCSEVNVGLMPLAEADKLFTDAVPEDVDDFAKIFMEASFGADRMERWGAYM